ncbi:MAG: glycoside hydrolase family 28 protein [Luteolibacter sp.]
MLKHTLLFIAFVGAATSAMAGETVESILARIKPPEFPNRDFLITDYGARQDSDSGEAIRAAILACHEAGGGRVVIPKGTFLTGAVHLKSHVNLHLSEGATLKFDTDPEKYPLVHTRWEGVECMNYSPLIYSYEQDNIAITGSGTLDGSATSKNWLRWKATKPALQTPGRTKLFQMGEDGVPVAERIFGSGYYLRPSFIQFYKGKNFLIEGVTITRSPMWVIHPVLCTNLTVRGVTVNSMGRNNDGCDPESCKDVLIEDCTFNTGDDCIAIKSGRNNDGRRINVPSENFVIRNCVMKAGHGGMTIGSEISGGCRNIFVSDIKMDSPNLNQAIRFKSNARRGGTIENIHIRDVKIGQVKISAISIELDYEEGAKGSHLPTLRDVLMENITTESCGQVLNLGGVPGAVIENITLKNSTFKGVKKADRISQAEKPTLENVTIEMAKDVP